MIRIRFSNAAMRDIKNRATDLQGGVWCELCGAECPTRADYEIDHVVPEGLRDQYDPRLPLAAEHGKLLCLPCHDKKTRRDMAEIAKTKRLEGKHRPIDRAGPTEIARRYKMPQEPHR